MHEKKNYEIMTCLALIAIEFQLNGDKKLLWCSASQRTLVLKSILIYCSILWGWHVPIAKITIILLCLSFKQSDHIQCGLDLKTPWKHVDFDKIVQK